MQLRSALLPICALVLLTESSSAGDIYVNANLTTGADDGSSWANAFQGPTGLRKASVQAASGQVIFVAQGKYQPAITLRKRSIPMKTGVQVYGGFLGTESSVEERPPIGSAPSIVTGDLNGDDAMGLYSDNSFHLFTAIGADSTAVLDGFELVSGNASGANSSEPFGAAILVKDSVGAPTIRNCSFSENRASLGGAVFVQNSGVSILDCSFESNVSIGWGGAVTVALTSSDPDVSPVKIDRCAFFDNLASWYGGALDVNLATVELTNCLFVNNSAIEGGGAIACANSDTVEQGALDMRGCTVVSNTTQNPYGAGLRTYGIGSFDLEVANSIFWENRGQQGVDSPYEQIYSQGTVRYSIVEGGISGSGNLDLDPAFADAAAGDYRLSAASPAIDAGDSNAAGKLLTLDLGGAPRRVDDPAVADSGTGGSPATDMGAFERCIGVVDTLCEALPNSTGTPSVLVATGSLSVIANDVNLVAEPLPQSQFGYFLLSASRDTIPVSAGVLCLGAPQLRFNQDVLDSGTAGSMSFSPDLKSLPQGQVVQPGETWYFQLWHRDGADSNFSSSLAFTWE